MRTRHSHAYPADHLRRSAMVFSPHFDDETLGCGGLIIKKKRAGADVKIVFMTDGSSSHRHLMPPQELASIRHREAIEAGQIMGLTRDDIIVLGFEEQQLGKHAQQAVERLTALLKLHAPIELWIPHAAEPLIWSPDHRDTTRIVKQAARQSGGAYSVYEYPVWLWFNYPWVDLPMSASSETLRLLKFSLSGAFGFRLAQSCRLDLDVRDVLEVKHAALAAYRSQMTRLKPDPAWGTLGDVANGQFLECFFQAREVFASGRLDE
jgi:LmbE family N-acetylglucosaminyl deacetylase